MKKTIDNVLLQCERSIQIFNSWIAECRDVYLKLDSFELLNMVISAQNVVRVYYHHWYSEFTEAQYHRMGRLLAFDPIKVHAEYARLVPNSEKVHSYDLPF